MAKIDWNVDYGECEPVEVNGVRFNVLKSIPYEKKTEMVSEYASTVVLLDEDGFAGVNPYANITWFYLTLKYYTDIELDLEKDNRGWIYDYAVKYNMQHMIESVCRDDLYTTWSFAAKMTDHLVESWKHQHSLAASLANVSADKTLEALARMKPMNDELIDLLRARDAAKQQKNVVPLAEFAKKEK